MLPIGRVYAYVNMKISTLVGFTRVKEYILQLTLSIPLILFYSPESLKTLSFLKVNLAILFLTAFAFSYNDIEDSIDDKQDSDKAVRNLVSSGRVERIEGLTISFALLVAGVALSYLIGYIPFILSVALASISFLYSWHGVRLKSTPYIDLALHSLIVGGLQFLILYLSFEPLNMELLYPLSFVILGSMASDVSQELRDFWVDRECGIRNTVQSIGLRNAYILLILLSVMTAVSFAIWLVHLTRLVYLPFYLLISLLFMYRISRRVLKFQARV